MKKLLFSFAMAVAVVSYAQDYKQDLCLDNTCCEASQCDPINIPVFIVDGVEVQNIDSITSDDVVKVEIIKDPAITKIFSPRLGGVVVITTKSKKFLKPIMEGYKKQTEAQRKNRIPGELLIR